MAQLFFACSNLGAGQATPPFPLPTGENDPSYYALIVRRDPNDPATANQPSSVQLQQLAADGSTWSTVETVSDGCIDFARQAGEARAHFHLARGSGQCRLVAGGVDVPWAGVCHAEDFF